MNKARMTIRFDHDPPKDSHKDHMREERDSHQNFPQGAMIELMTVILYSTSLTQRLIGLPMRAIRLNIGAMR